jgi:hypothetical protein
VGDRKRKVQKQSDDKKKKRNKSELQTGKRSCSCKELQLQREKKKSKEGGGVCARETLRNSSRSLSMSEMVAWKCLRKEAANLPKETCAKPREGASIGHTKKKSKEQP